MHPFSRYIQILGKGRKGQRSLTQQEAFEAMHMITCYDVQPEQLGAFLMLMRVKEETAEEIAGFTQALRKSIPTSDNWYTPAIDWAAYAGKKRQLPWFLLAALILASRGHSVLMHGMERDDDRIYIPQALKALGLEPSHSLRHAEQTLKIQGFAYLPINILSPLASELIDTRELLGLRPPLHTVARMLNPFYAPLSVMGIFHPNFAPIHQQAASLLEQKTCLICKGEGGEFERIPERSSVLYGINNNQEWSETWDKLVKPGKDIKPAHLSLEHFRSVWIGKTEDTYANHAIIGTLAWVIKALQIETTEVDAHVLASQWWQERLQYSQFQEAI